MCLGVRFYRVLAREPKLPGVLVWDAQSPPRDGGRSGAGPEAGNLRALLSVGAVAGYLPRRRPFGVPAANGEVSSCMTSRAHAGGMAIQVADACIWLLIAALLPAAAGQSKLVCSQSPTVVKAGLKESAAIFCQLVNYNYTNSTYVIWSFISRLSAGDNLVMLRGGERKYYYQAIQSDQFPTLDIERITADTLLYPSYNVTVMQEDVPVLKSEFSLRVVGLETTSTSATLKPSGFEASATEPTVATSPSSQPSTRKSTGAFTTAWFVTEHQEPTNDIRRPIPSTVGENVQPTVTVTQASAASRAVSSNAVVITVPTVKQTKVSTFFTNLRTAEIDYATQSTSRVPSSPQGRTSPPPSNANDGSTDRSSFQCSQYPSIATVQVGKDVAITCQLYAANWTNESFVSWTFSTRSPKYGYRSVTIKNGEHMYAVEAIKDIKFPTIFISRIMESLLEFPDFKVTFNNGTNEVFSTVYTTRIQGVMSQSTQPSSNPALSVSATSSSTGISSDWHSTRLETDLARSTEPQADFRSHTISTTATVAPASLTAAEGSSVSTTAVTESSLSTNALASETQQFSASSTLQNFFANLATSSQPVKTNGFFWTSATTVNMPSNIQLTSEKLSSTRVSMSSTTERNSQSAAFSPPASLSVMGGSTTEGMRTTADSTVATTKSLLSALSSYASTGNIYSLSSSSGVTMSTRATTVSSLFSIEATVPATQLSSVRISEPVPATFSQAEASAASLAATSARSSTPNNESASSVSTPRLSASSWAASSLRSGTVESLPLTTKMAVVLATTSSTASQQLSTETGTALQNSTTARSSSDWVTITTIPNMTLTRQTAAWPHASLSHEQITNVTSSSPPYHDTVEVGSLRTLTNSAAPAVATAAATLWTAAPNSSAAMLMSTSAEGTQQSELPKASSLTAAPTIIPALLPLSSAKSILSSAFHAAFNSGLTSTPSSVVEPSTNSSAVRLAPTTSNTLTTFSSTLMGSAALNLSRDTATNNFVRSSSNTTTEETVATTSTTAYSTTPRGHSSNNANSELMSSGAIPNPISALNVSAASTYAAALAFSSLPTAPSNKIDSQTVAPTPTVNYSRVEAVNVLHGDSLSIVVSTEGLSSGSTAQKPTAIETQSTVRVPSTQRHTTRGTKLPQIDTASGASSCFLSHLTLVILLLLAKL